MSQESTEKVDLFAPIPNKDSTFGKYSQEDIDFVMKKGKLMSGNDKVLENAYLDWASNSAASCNAWIMAYCGFESKLFKLDELNMIHIATSLYNDCNFCIEKHIEWGHKFLGLSLKGVEMAKRSLPVKMMAIVSSSSSSAAAAASPSPPTSSLSSSVSDNNNNNNNNSGDSDSDEKEKDDSNSIVYDKDWSKRYDNIMKATYFILEKNGKLNDDDRTYLKNTFKLTTGELTEMAYNIGLMIMANYMNHVIGSEWKENVCFNPNAKNDSNVSNTQK